MLFKMCWMCICYCSQGVNKDSYLILETLPTEYDSRVKAMEVDERPTEQYSDIGGLDKQIQEVLKFLTMTVLLTECKLTYFWAHCFALCSWWRQLFCPWTTKRSLRIWGSNHQREFWCTDHQAQERPCWPEHVQPKPRCSVSERERNINANYLFELHPLRFGVINPLIYTNSEFRKCSLVLLLFLGKKNRSSFQTLKLPLIIKITIYIIFK